MAERLSDQEIEQRLEGGEWRRDGDTIVRELSFEDFKRAVSFVNRVADAAEAANHHHDITIHGWNKVRLSLSTHSAGGITGADFQLAGTLDGLA